MRSSASGGGATTSATTRRFAAPAGLESDYRTLPPQGAAVSGPGSEAIVPGLERAAAATGRSLHGDPRLSALCAWVAAQVDSTGSTPPHAAVDLAAHHLGLFEPVPHLIVLGLPLDADLGERVQAEAAPMLKQLEYTHYGALAQERDGGRLVVVALSWRWFEADPVPSRSKIGDSITLRGKLNAGYRAPELAVTAPDGRSSRRTLGDGPRFQVKVPFGSSGTYRIELLAQGALGSTVVANFPVYVGVEPPREVSVTESALADLDDAPARFLQLINQERATLGLSALALDAEASEVASAHCRDMRDHGFVGHTSPTTGSAAQRVSAAGIRTGTVLENIGRGYGLEEVHQGLMSSPGHRDNVLSPRVTHVGVGLVQEGEADHPSFLVTQVFIRRASPIDLDAAPGELLEALNRERKARGQATLSRDATLDDAAAAGARRYFAEPKQAQQSLVQDVNDKLGKLRLPYKKLATVMVVVDGLDQAASVAAAAEAKASHVGIGIAQGTRPDGIENAIAVIMLLAL
jgi:uncharacterized protein YkwD